MVSLASVESAAAPLRARAHALIQTCVVVSGPKLSRRPCAQDRWVRPYPRTLNAHAVDCATLDPRGVRCLPPWVTRWGAEGRALEAAADAVEARLLAGETRLAVWHELAARHQQVSEISCRIADAHFQDMARLFEEQAEKGRGMHRARAWANAAEPPGGIGGPRVPVIDVH